MVALVQSKTSVDDVDQLQVGWLQGSEGTDACLGVWSIQLEV
jgi:hypothetical protein